MIMYYPQDIYKEIGPTGIVPGSHYIAQRLAGIDQLSSYAHGPAGTCTMIHYDIWHRKMKNFTDLRRYMVKFEFIRMRRPSAVTWDSAVTDWSNPADQPGVALEPVWRATWHWLGGRSLPDLTPDANVELDAAVIGIAGPDDRQRAAAIADIARLGQGQSP